MAKSPYERARKFSGYLHLNQRTGKYERRDENWLAPEDSSECDYCGEPTPNNELVSSGEQVPTGNKLDTPAKLPMYDSWGDIEDGAFRYDHNEYRPAMICKDCLR